MAGFTAFALTRLVGGLTELRNGYGYLTELKTCDQLLLRQLTSGQSILLSGADNVDGDILVELRLNHSRLKQKVESLKSGPFNTFSGEDREIILSLTEFYGVINSSLITRLFNREDIDPIRLSTEISENIELCQNLWESLNFWQWRSCPVCPARRPAA